MHSLNERSSRAHTVLSVAIKATNRFSGELTYGSLRLVDLAGSELVAHRHGAQRAGRLASAAAAASGSPDGLHGSVAEADLRRLEGEHIHHSLSALSAVLRALLHVRAGRCCAWAAAARAARHAHLISGLPHAPRFARCARCPLPASCAPNPCRVKTR